MALFGGKNVTVEPRIKMGYSSNQLDLNPSFGPLSQPNMPQITSPAVFQIWKAAGLFLLWGYTRLSTQRVQNNKTPVLRVEAISA